MKMIPDPRSSTAHFIDYAYEEGVHFCWSWVDEAGLPCRLCPSLDPQNLQTDAPEKTNMRMLLVASIGTKVYLLIIAAQQGGTVG